MDARVRRALETERTIDITTTGRTTGRPHRIEMWFHNLDGRLYLTGTPGARGWHANLLAHPEFTFHLKGTVRADLPARATPDRGPGAAPGDPLSPPRAAGSRGGAGRLGPRESAGRGGDPRERADRGPGSTVDGLKTAGPLTNATRKAARGDLTGGAGSRMPRAPIGTKVDRTSRASIVPAPTAAVTRPRAPARASDHDSAERGSRPAGRAEIPRRACGRRRPAGIVTLRLRIHGARGRTAEWAWTPLTAS